MCDGVVTVPTVTAASGPTGVSLSGRSGWCVDAGDGGSHGDGDGDGGRWLRLGSVALGWLPAVECGVEGDVHGDFARHVVCVVTPVAPTVDRRCVVVGCWSRRR